MSGAPSHSGYIYQSRIVLYLLIRSLLVNEYKSSCIEIQIKIEKSGELSDIDLWIENQKGEKTWYEFKNVKDFYTPKKIKGVVRDFFNRFSTSTDRNRDRYILVHSTQRKGCLDGMHINSIERKKYIQEWLNNDPTLDDFNSKLSFTQIIDDVDEDLNMSTIEIISCLLIKKILYEKWDTVSWEESVGIYNAIFNGFNNQIQQYEKRLKNIKTVNVASETGLIIDFYSLLRCEQSLIPFLREFLKNKKGTTYSMVETELEFADKFSFAKVKLEPVTGL